MLSSHQRGLLAAFGSPIVEGSSAQENFERLVKWSDYFERHDLLRSISADSCCRKGWKRNSTSCRAVSKAYFSTDSQKRHEDDSEDDSQSEDGVIVTPGTSDDGIKLVSFDDDEGGLDGALARLELSERRLKDRVRKSIDSNDQGEHQHDAHDASAGENARYFDRFPSFEPDNSIPIQEEFKRLAKTMRWVEDSEHFLAEQQKAYASELQYFMYARSGRDATALNHAQAFCKDLGITPLPPSMNQCKKVSNWV